MDVENVSNTSVRGAQQQDDEPVVAKRRTFIQSHTMRLRDNVRCKNFWQETSGALGDLGTFIHILLALAYANGVDLGTTLLFTGVYNVVTGLAFGVPMPVQPMKSKKNKSKGDRKWVGLDGRLLAIAASAFIVLCTGPGGGRQCGCSTEESNERNQQEGDRSRISENNNAQERSKWMIPAGVIVFLVGVVLAIVRDPKTLGALKLGPSPLDVVSISRHDWKVGFVMAAIPQIPLSVLNSVIAVCKLSNDLFPEKVVTVFFVSTSVCMMNLVGCWFGAMQCVMVQGLAGQYKFGARNGLAPVLLGAAKLVVSLLLGSSLLRLLSSFPIALLGALLLFSGVELAMACRDQNSNEDAFVMLVCIIVSLSKASAAIGFACGMAVFILLKLRLLLTSYGKWILGVRSFMKK